MKLKSVSAAFAAILLLLCGCGAEAALPEPTPTQYTVRYYIEGELQLEEALSEGLSPAAVPDEAGAGLVILRWLDESGNATDPSAVSVSSDLRFFAFTAPTFDRHVPYLFTDEYGFLHPDAAFSASDLKSALCALTAPEYVSRIVLPDEDVPLTAGEMKSCLRSYFTDEKLDAAFSAIDAGQELSRADAAAVLNVLLDRDTGEALVSAPEAVVIPDLLPEREDLDQLLEAAQPHTHGASDGENADTAIAALYEAGFVNLNGALYCIGEDGYIVTDQEVGGLYFSDDGTFTSGSDILDSYVEQILADIIAAAPDAERIDWLRSAFNYARDSFTYLRKPAYLFGATDWQVDDALVMLEGGLGNCYNYAAVFWALARGLGYDAQAVSGTVGSSRQPHGWVIITLDEQTYYCDPELEMAYLAKGNSSHDMFMMNTYTASAWSYVW